MKWNLTRFTIVLAVALTAWLWPSILGGKVLLPLDILSHMPPFAPESAGPIHNELIGDMLVENFAWKTFQRECVTNGELPLWTPYAFCGHPIYTTGQTATFYPLNALFWVIPIPQAYIVYTWLHLLLGGIFAYLFFRRVGVGGFGASVGGLMFAMSTYLAVRFIWPMLLGSAIWLPLMLLWIDYMTEPRARRELLFGIPAGAVLFAMPLLSGFFEIAFYVYAACGLYTVFLGLALVWREWSLRSGAVFFGKVAAVTGLAVVLSLPQLLPFLEVMKKNVRAGELTYDEAIKNGLTLKDAVTFAVPDALGNPSTHEQYSLRDREWKPIKAKGGQDFHYFGSINYVEATNYLGLLPLMFVAISPLAPGRRRLFFWLLLTISLALAFATPLYWIFYHLVPGTDQVRTPFRWTLLSMFACTYLAAIGADNWHERLSHAPHGFMKAAALTKLAAVVVAAAAVAALFFFPERISGWAAGILTADPRAASVFADPSQLANLLWMNAARLAVFGLAGMLLVALAYWRAWGPKSIAVFSLAAIALVAFDLGEATYRFNTHADPKILDTVPPVVQHLEAEAKQDVFRVARFGWQRMLAPNLLTLYGIQEPGGYDSIILTHYARYMEAIEHLKHLHYNIIMGFEQKATLDSPLFRLLSIRYLLSVKPLSHPDYELVDLPGDLKLSRIKPEKAMPRAFLVNRVHGVWNLDEAIDAIKTGKVDIKRTATVQTIPGQSSSLVGMLTGDPGEARITSYRPSRVEVTTSAPGQQLLVLSDVYYPGWRAYVDKTPADIIVTNGIFRGVSVPAGEHTVEFRFEPALFCTGVTLSLACFGGLIVVLLVRLIAGRKRGNLHRESLAGVS